VQHRRLKVGGMFFDSGSRRLQSAGLATRPAPTKNERDMSLRRLMKETGRS
jgi:hypothetical protein